jgi:hypothetical protein
MQNQVLVSYVSHAGGRVQITLFGRGADHQANEQAAAHSTSSRIGSSEVHAVGYAQGCPLVIHSNPRAGWSRPAAGPGLGPAHS